MSFVEVLPPELTGPDHLEWFAARRTGVTASEIAAILGLSPYESPFSLYWRKKGVIGEQADNDGMRWGRRLERYILDEFIQRHCDEFDFGWAGLYAHAERSWQMASPDALLVDANGGTLLNPVALAEAKTTGSWDGWGPDGSDEVPIHIRCQVIWQADVLSVPCVYVPVVNGRTYREYVVEADPADAEVMRKAALLFLDRVAADDPPGVDGTEPTLRALKQLHPDLDDTEAQVPLGLAEAWRRACRNTAKATARKKTLEAELRARMGRARVAVDKYGDKVATRSIYPVREHVRPASTVDKLTPAREMTP